MIDNKMNKATLANDIESIEEVRNIHSKICPDCKIVQIKSMRTHINKKLMNNVIDLSHIGFSAKALKIALNNGFKPQIQPYTGSMNHWSNASQLTQKQIQAAVKNSKAKIFQSRRFKCFKCNDEGCYIRRHVLDDGSLGFIGNTRGGKCGTTYTMIEARTAPVFYDMSNVPTFNHKITMIMVEMIDGVWSIPSVYRNPSHDGLYQFTGMKGVTAVGNQKVIAPMYRRNISINGKQKQVYHQMTTAYLGDGEYALVMVKPNSETNVKTLFEYPPLGIINNIGVKGVKK